MKRNRFKANLFSFPPFFLPERNTSCHVFDDSVYMKTPTWSYAFSVLLGCLVEERSRAVKCLSTEAGLESPLGWKHQPSVGRRF
jgi:hypothetical protein